VAAQKETENISGASKAPCLRIEHVTKSFGGLEAVRDVSLSLSEGEHRAILGPNGAGKTTFFNVIAGELPTTSGRVFFLGRDITKLPSHRRARRGLARTFQITNLFPTLTVLENLVIAAMGLKGMKFSMLRPLATYRGLYERADEVLKEVGMAEKRDEVVRNLSYGEQRQVEVSLALISNPRVLLLDEPTAGLSPADTAMMTEMIHQLDSRITLLLIEHNMDVALQAASLSAAAEMPAIMPRKTRACRG